MTRASRCLMVFATLSVVTQAEDMKWDDLCGAAKARELTIVTNAGMKVRGKCWTQTADSILIDAKNGGPIWRSAIKSIRLDKGRRWHSTPHVVEMANELALGGTITLASPVFFLGPPLLAGALGTLAGAPFCALHDWLHSPSTEKITIK